MTTLNGRTALVLGGSSGVGRATVEALATAGAQVTAVARGEARLHAVRDAVGPAVTCAVGDAADKAFIAGLLRTHMPDHVVLAAGAMPRVDELDTFDWDEFSSAWNFDVKAAFHLVTEALAIPLRPGSTVVLVSSGAAVRGSPLSGGYAGAKRMQWFLANYAQGLSDARQLGLRFVAVVPEQLIEGTAIGALASEGYAARQGITAAAFMARYDTPHTPATIAAVIVDALRGGVPVGTNVVGVRGGEVAPLA